MRHTKGCNRFCEIPLPTRIFPRPAGEATHFLLRFFDRGITAVRSCTGPMTFDFYLGASFKFGLVPHSFFKNHLWLIPFVWRFKMTALPTVQCATGHQATVSQLETRSIIRPGSQQAAIVAASQRHPSCSAAPKWAAIPPSAIKLACTARKFLFFTQHLTRSNVGGKALALFPST